MQMSVTIMVGGGKQSTREGKSRHVPVQGVWFKSLDLKTTSPEKLTIMGFPENFLCPPKGPENPQPELLKTTVMRCYK